MEYNFLIRSISLARAHFEMNPEVNVGGNGYAKAGAQIAVQHHRKNRRLFVTVTAASTDKEEVFAFDVAFTGIFEFKGWLPRHQDLDRIASINCAAIIFPYVRQTVASLAMSAGVVPLQLEPVNFILLYEKDKEAAQQK